MGRVLRSPPLAAAALCLLGGCCHQHLFPEQWFPVREHIDAAVCGMAGRPADPQPLTHAAVPPTTEEELPPPRPVKEPSEKGQKDDAQDGREVGPVTASGLRHARAEEPAPRNNDRSAGGRKALTIPPGLPGADAPELRLPPGKADSPERARAVGHVYPPPPLPCHHPCSPLPDPAFKGADGRWPAAPVEVQPGAGDAAHSPGPEEDRPELLPPPRRRPPEGAAPDDGVSHLPGRLLPALSTNR